MLLFFLNKKNILMFIICILSNLKVILIIFMSLESLTLLCIDYRSVYTVYKKILKMFSNSSY